MSMDYENYIWDLGGTLLDNYESSSHAFAAALWGMAARVVLHDEIYAALKVSTAFAVDKFASDIPNFLAKYKSLEAVTLQKPILFDGAVEVLTSLSRAGKRNFMISHRDKQVLTILSDAKIASFFTEVVTSDNGFPRKPSPDSILYLLEKYALDAKKTVMIGDRAIDIQAGNAAGVTSIFFDSQKTLSEATQNIRYLQELLG